MKSSGVRVHLACLTVDVITIYLARIEWTTADIIHSFPGDPIPNVPVGIPGSGKEINAKANHHSGAKAEKVLGIEYVPLQVSVEDMYKSLKERF